MKKFFVLLLLAFFVYSCATDRIRYVRVKGQEKEVVTIASEDHKDTYEPEAKNETNLRLTSSDKEGQLVAELQEDIAPAEVVSTKPSNKSESGINPLFSDEEDPLNEKVDAALWAEDQAFRSRRNMRLSMIFLSLTVIPYAGLVLFFIPALILFIIGWTQYASANRSRYITVKGDALLHSAKKGFYVWGAYILLLFLAAALVIGLYYYW